VVRGVARQRSRMLKCYDSTKNHENLVQMGNGEQQFRVGLSQVADWALAFSGLSTSGCCSSHRRNRMVSMPLSAVSRVAVS